MNLMNTRVIALVIQGADRWTLAGEQLFIDLDLSAHDIPPSTQFALGSAVVGVADQLHTGCQKFVQLFGVDALKWISFPVGKLLQLGWALDQNFETYAPQAPISTTGY